MGVRLSRLPRVTQPQDAAAISNAFPWAFVWSATDPGANLRSGQRVTVTGTPSTGPVGRWVDYQSATAIQSYNATLPTTGYTFVAVVHPTTGSIPAQRAMLRTTGGAFRFEGGTSAGGVYWYVTHTGVAAGASLVIGVGGFDTRPWTVVGTGDGVNSKLWSRSPDGEISYFSQAAGLASGTGTIDLSTTGGSSGISLAAVSNQCATDAYAMELVSRPWQVFADEEIIIPTVAAGGTTDGVGASAGTATASATSQTIAASVGASAASAGASSQAQAIWQGVGSSAAAGAAQAVGTDGAAGVTSAIGSATATSTAAGAGRAVWGALGAAYGFIAPVGVSQTIEYRAATSAGSATASADGTEASAYEPRAATAAATSLAAATSRVVVAAIGAIVSTAVASGVSDAASTVQTAVGVAAAVAVATGVAQAVWAAVGSSTGSGAAEGYPPQTLTASQLAAQAIVQAFTPEVYVRDGPTTIRITL